MATVVAPANCTASLGSIQNFFGYLGAALAPIVTGAIAAKTASFQPALLVGAAVAATGAVIHLVLVRHPMTEHAAPPGC
jgi:cyanate permease